MLGGKVSIHILTGTKFCKLCELSTVCAMCVLSQSCPAFCDPMDCSPPSSSVHGILQARILEWVVMLSFRGSSRLGDQARVFCLRIGRRGLYCPGPPGKPFIYSILFSEASLFQFRFSGFANMLTYLLPSVYLCLRKECIWGQAVSINSDQTSRHK